MANNRSTLCSPAVGRRRRDAALSALESRRAALIACGVRALLTVLLRRGRATPDDVRMELGELPGDADPRWVGAVPRGLCRAAVSHARPVSVWRLVDREAALARLRELTPAAPEPIGPAPVTGLAAQPLLWTD